MKNLIKSRQRVSDHGEVFTPDWLVNSMLALVDPEVCRLDSRFLEPACGSGNFLAPILQRRLVSVDQKYLGSEFERLHYAMLGLMCLYGVELLGDNVRECRANLLEIFLNHLGLSQDSPGARAARAVLHLNIVQGDALSLLDYSGYPIIFPEWSYLGKGLFNRRDFKYDELLQMSSFGEGTLFEGFEGDQIFAPVRDYPVLKMHDIAQFAPESN